MSTFVVFHHALGLTVGVASFAEQLRAAGHRVITPDLFGGEHFDTIEAGVAHATSIGFGELIERGVVAFDDAVGRSDDSDDENVVVVGFSLGVLPAQRLAQTDPRVTAAALCHSCVPVEEFGEVWPTDVGVQIHAMEADPYFLDDGDMDAALELVGSVCDAELYLYPGDLHLFADASLPSHDPAAAAELLERVAALG